MKPPINFYVSKGFKEAERDSDRLQQTILAISRGLDRSITLTENMSVQLLTVRFSTPTQLDLSILTKFTTRPLWVELLSFAKVLPTHEAKSLGTTFRWTWGDRTINTDVFTGMPDDGSVYEIQLLAFLQ